MYKITFHNQTRHNEPDTEFGSIIVNDLNVLPVLSGKLFDENCSFHKGWFAEKVRHPEISFPALWIHNPNWKFNESWMLDDRYSWVFVCLDEEKDVWIAFKYYDAASLGDAYGSTVSVSWPSHDTVYRLGDKCKELLNKYYYN